MTKTDTPIYHLELAAYSPTMGFNQKAIIVNGTNNAFKLAIMLESITVNNFAPIAKNPTYPNVKTKVQNVAPTSHPDIDKSPKKHFIASPWCFHICFHVNPLLYPNTLN